MQAAEATLLKARAEGRARVEAAEQRKQQAIQLTQDVAQESKALSQARIEDAKRRTEEMEAWVQHQAREV